MSDRSKLRRRGLLVAAILVLTGARDAQAQGDAPAQAPSPGAEAALAETIIQAHNALRAEFGAPPLSWDEGLAREALAWAKVNLAERRLRHSPPKARIGEGENLAAVYGGHWGAKALLKLWTDERALYVFGPLDCSRKGPPKPETRHYTQMIWPGTLTVGCGLASNRHGEVLACRYAPPGNYCGEAPY